MAGSEAAWQAAERGLRVRLIEMRPFVQTGAHTGPYLAELVCSNSLGSDLPDRAPGLLKAELRKLGSLLMRCADQAALPAGRALAVDRELFARGVTEALGQHPRIQIVREEATEIPAGLAILASGPLTSTRLSAAIQAFLGTDHLYFYDAIAPVVTIESIDMSIAFRGSRYDQVEPDAGDYLNCPLDEGQYRVFVQTLLSAERIPLRDFERDLEQGVRAGAHHFFEGCLPIEILARRGEKALAFGPMRPVGLVDPHNGRRPSAVVQLRQDNQAGTLYNLVGFQTNLTFPEQRRVLRLIPGLERAEFARYGQMHRNTFIYSPAALEANLQSRRRGELFFAGQITGVEGYVGNIGTGLLAGWNAARLAHGLSPLRLPMTTMLGALCHYVTHASPVDFQPMKANYGLLPPMVLPGRPGKRERAAAFTARALADLEAFLQAAGLEENPAWQFYYKGRMSRGEKS